MDKNDMIFQQKQEFHKKQAKLPIEDKIKLLVKLQKIYLNMMKSRGKKTDNILWKL